MNILITDSSLGVGIFPEGGQSQPIPCDLECPYMPACVQDRLFLCCRKGLDCLCLRRGDLQPMLRLPAMPALAALCPSPCGRYLYQLSTEADAVHTHLLSTGELAYATPVGVFPRSMHMDPQGRWLLVAGGAMNEVYLLSAPELARLHTIHTKSPCFSADFWRDGLVLVCAAEEDGIQTIVYTWAFGKPRPREVQRLPGQPGGLCVCPDGVSALLSTPDGLMKLDIATGKLLWNLPQWALAMRLCCQGGWGLISDTLNGQVCLFCHEHPWKSRVLLTGTDAQACFL